ncbi:MAG: DUF554 domain-containing protein [Erysipelotrichaceae bacterium]|jgi:uncharacterized membrane protein YqgA involved in biofilm formation|nr:DUF554 domain-containing protein [Erysipelotrichaceae bacterium]MCI1326154.1 DUF554 domain-containing protein [Solobacterium sp.]MCH4045641.1 DUF554 domain-containing protein [Erysipelotrichaceae bacterium]MCH4122850.1 DUF554 domain-containing protein [Erysipelotrichaceae bacterium]MCI1363631.1 DUF554 domain-containing protein [Solobacterium sp.]
MAGLGTLINALAIIAGGIIGMVFGKKIPERMQETLLKVNGTAVLFIGIGGVMSKMLTIKDGVVNTQGSMMMIGSLAIGTVAGELLDLDGWMHRFGVCLQKKTGNGSDSHFIEGFVSASLTVCIGAMAIVGAIADGIDGNHSVLFAKAVLDLIIVMVMSASLGKGCLFSFIPVVILQGSVTLLAKLIAPLITTAALNNISYVGSVLIFCVGVNLVFDSKIRVANILPAILVAALWP